MDACFPSFNITLPLSCYFDDDEMEFINNFLTTESRKQEVVSYQKSLNKVRSHNYVWTCNMCHHRSFVLTPTLIFSTSTRSSSSLNNDDQKNASAAFLLRWNDWWVNVCSMTSQSWSRGNSKCTKWFSCDISCRISRFGRYHFFGRFIPPVVALLLLSWLIHKLMY